VSRLVNFEILDWRDFRQMVRIKATFDKPGRFVRHGHTLSHEDHEMMRVLQI
jgi:FtsP/CotA-like multicopper oxidase with cupredoxin domain